jgi:hypothetical protein
LNKTGLVYVIWFASELCLSVTMMCCSAGLVTRVEFEQRNQSEISCEIKKTLTECFQLLKEVYGDNVMSRMLVLEWHKRFMEGRENVKAVMIVFFNIRGMIMIERIPEGQMVNRTYYLEVLTKLQE